MKICLVFLLLTLCCLGAAQDWAKARLEASPRHQEWVSLEHGERTLKCFVVYPERPGNTQAVVLIHEIMGLTDWVMSVADRLAEEGYIAIAPDFLTGMAPGGGRTIDFPDVGAAREAIGSLHPDQVTNDLDAAVGYARKLPSSNGVVSVGGFCWGGSQTFRYATNQPNLAAAFVFYGSGPTNAEAHKAINAPVYGFYGGADNRVNATIPASEEMMKAAGKVFEPVIYEGAGHGFMRSGDGPEPAELNAAARVAAWERWLGILKGLG